MYSKRKLQKKKLLKLFTVTLTFKLYIFFKVKYRVKTFQKYYFSKQPPQSFVMKIWAESLGILNTLKMNLFERSMVKDIPIRLNSMKDTLYEQKLQVCSSRDGRPATELISVFHKYTSTWKRELCCHFFELQNGLGIYSSYCLHFFAFDLFVCWFLFSWNILNFLQEITR